MGLGGVGCGVPEMGCRNPVSTTGEEPGVNVPGGIVGRKAVAGFGARAGRPYKPFDRDVGRDKGWPDEGRLKRRVRNPGGHPGFPLASRYCPGRCTG